LQLFVGRQSYLIGGVKRVRHGRAIVLPFSDKTRGHGSHTIAALWKDQLVKLLKETERAK